MNVPQPVFNIGKCAFGSRVVLAPMAGITDLPFRLFARKAGAGIVWSEMVSSMAMHHRHKRTQSMMQIHRDEHPVAVQIFGGDPKRMAESAKKVQDAGADIVDINLGCPVPKVKRSGSGIQLIKQGTRWIDIIASVVKAVTVPVTVKMRTGLKVGENIAPEICYVAEREGAAAVIIHARTASQMHKGDPDWDAVAEAVAKVSIPVIANGGIYDGPSAKEAFERTGCAAVMVGQAAIGDFDIFRRINRYLESGKLLPVPQNHEKKKQFLEHLKSNVEQYGEELGIKRLRKVLPAYFKGFPDAAVMRNRLLLMTEVETIEGYLLSSIKSQKK